MFIFFIGYQGRPEPLAVSEAVRGVGRGPGDDQAVLPRRRDRPQDVLREQVGGPQVAAARPLALHADHGRVDQELCRDPEQSR